jgi:hypothetical protein
MTRGPLMPFRSTESLTDLAALAENLDRDGRLS